MRQHFDSWLEFANGEDANGWGLDLRDNDLVFVSGMIKTKRWAVMSYHNRVFRDKEGLLTADFSPFASARLSVSISEETLSANHYRSGPEENHPAPLSPIAPGNDRGASTEPDQCIFINYFKMRRPFKWPFNKDPMQAAAGPQDYRRGGTPDTDSGFAESMSDRGSCDRRSGTPDTESGIAESMSDGGRYDFEGMSDCGSCTWGPIPHPLPGVDNVSVPAYLIRSL